MLKIAICDDDPVFLFQTRALIERWNDHRQELIIREFENGDALINSLKELSYDIMFLDVIMPLFNGIEVAREIRKYDSTSKIIFLTSSPEFALDSYSVKAANYLLKPVEPAKLFQALDDIVTNLPHSTHSITVKTASAIHRVQLQNIEYLEAQNKHVLFILSNGTTLDAIEPLHVYSNRLLVDKSFFKCHRSYIINLHQVASYTSKEIQTHSGARLPIARACQHEFEKAYQSAVRQNDVHSRFYKK